MQLLKSLGIVLKQLDLRNFLCGHIGLEDYTLFPLIRAGSFVEIDEHQNKVKPGNWQNEFDRPIYFVELRGGFACSWCELDGNQLVLVPSPQSRGQIRHLDTQPRRTSSAESLR
jgi:hypothetical protein